MNETKITKNTARLWLVIFPGIMLLALVGFLALMGKPVSTESENRNPVTWDEVMAAPLEEKSSVFESWFNDRFPLRGELTIGNGLADYFVFGDSASSQVVRGKEGWCFYRGDEDYCLDQYKGIENCSDETMGEILENLTNTRDYLAERGIDFIVMIVPGKQRIYSEYMPDEIKVIDEKCNTDEVVSAIRENTDIKLLWLEENFEKYKSENPGGTPLYYKLESHWNDFGAYVGTSVLLSELGVKGYEKDDFSSEALFERGITITQKKQTELDLTKLMNLSSVLSDTAYEVEGYSENIPEIFKGKDAAEVAGTAGLFENEESEDEAYSEIIISENDSAPDKRKIYLYGDSFSRYMVSYLGSEFSQVYRNDEIDNEQLFAVSPDVVVFEIVERNIGRLDDEDIVTEADDPQKQ